MPGGGDRGLDRQLDGQRRRTGRIGRRDIDLDTRRIGPDIADDPQIADGNDDKLGVGDRLGDLPHRRHPGVRAASGRRYHVSPG